MIEKKQKNVIILRLVISFFTLLGLIMIPRICANAETQVLEGGEEEGYVVKYDTDTEECVVTFTTNNGVRDWRKTELNYETNQYESIAGKYADKITKVVIGKDVTKAYISGSVIPGFTKLQTIEIESGNPKLCVEDNIVYNIKKGAKGNEMLLLPMSKCTEEYTLPDDVRVIGDHLFDSNTVVKKVIAKDLDSVGSWAFNQSSVQEFECNTLKTIYDSGFQYAKNLEKITIKSNGSNPVSLSDSAFNGCAKLKEFPYYATLDGGGAGGYFSGCRSLTGFTIEDTETNIYVYSFKACVSLTSMVIPASVDSIGAGAFESCNNLTTLEFKSVDPPSFQSDSLRGCPENMEIIVPEGSEDAYIEALLTATGYDYTDNIKNTGVTKYSLFVNGEQFTSSNLTITCGSGTAVYDPETNTLTLTNASINKGIGKYAYGGCINSGISDLEIKLVGDNAIDATGTYFDGISNEAGCNITLTGTGCLSVTADAGCCSAYVGLGSDPTGIDGGDFIIDGPTFKSSSSIQVNRSFIVQNSADVELSGIVKSNQGGNIEVKSDASLKAKALDLGSPLMNGEPVYQKDMKVIVDGGSLELTGGGIHFQDGSNTKDDTRGYIKILDGSIKIDQRAEEGERIADCPADHITIDDSFGITVDDFLKGDIEAESSTQRKVIIDMGGHGENITFKVDKGTEINERSLYEREDVIKAVNDDPTFAGFRLKPLSEFKDYDDFFANRENWGTIEGKGSGWIGWKTKVDSNIHVYACWFKTIDKAEVTINAPVCGKETHYIDESKSYELSYKPEAQVPSGKNYSIAKDKDKDDKLFDSLYWLTEAVYDADDYYRGSFTADNKYGAEIIIEAKFGYVFAPKTNTTVEGAEFKECVTDVKHGEMPYIGYHLVVIAEVTPVHTYGKWTKLDADYHQRVCEGDASHVEKAAHSWDGGVITKEATTETDGEKTFTCKDCGATKIEKIEKLPATPAPTNPAVTPTSDPGTQPTVTPSATPTSDRLEQKGEDGTAVGKGASIEVAEKAITSMTNDNDPAGSVFNVLQAKAAKVTKNSIKVSWKKPAGAVKFVIYANKCGKGNKPLKITEVSGTSFTLKKLNNKNLNKGTYYKFLIVAVDKNDNVVSTSKVIHAATLGGKVGNCKKLTTKAKKNKVTVKAKKTFKLKPTQKAEKKKLKIKNHRKLMYESSDTSIATVNKSGVIKGLKKGKCTVYVYAQNGIFKKITVTVK